jgi:nucleoside-diphosphate-sugar epimerase
MKILVTGSSGTIGTHLCDTLLKRGDQVVGMDIVPNKWQPSVQAVTVIGDLRKKEDFSQLPKDIDICIHLGANARVYELVEDPERALDNFVTLFHTLEFCRKNGVKKFLFASSREGYGNVHADLYTEDMVRLENCESPYTASKVGGEALVHAYEKCYDIECIIFRFSNVYGMYDDSERVVPLFIRKARKGEKLTVFGNKSLDFTYIDDAIQALIRAIDDFDAAKGDTYNIAYGEGNTIVKLAETINEYFKSAGGIDLGNIRTGEISRYVADISKAVQKLGYKPKTAFGEGLMKAIEWYVKNT